MNTKPLKVFILEDLKTDQELNRRAVLKFNPNATFTIANNRTSFFEKIEWLRPDLILADYNLPDINGLEVLFYVKEKLPDIPFIFVSATLNNEEAVAEAIIKGADGYVSKNNLSSLPDHLTEITNRMSVRMQQRLEKEKRKNKRSILMQKLEASIGKLSNEDERAELLSIINEIQELT